MSNEDYNKLSAKLVAHERILAHLLAPVVTGLSQLERDDLVESLSEPEGHPDYGPGTDIGTANDIASLELHHRAEVQRVFQLALLGDHDDNLGVEIPADFDTSASAAS